MIHKSQKGLHFTKGLRSTGGPDLLKWGLPGGAGEGSNLLKSRRPLMSTTPPWSGRAVRDSEGTRHCFGI